MRPSTNTVIVDKSSSLQVHHFTGGGNVGCKVQVSGIWHYEWVPPMKGDHKGHSTRGFWTGQSCQSGFWTPSPNVRHGRTVYSSMQDARTAGDGFRRIHQPHLGGGCIAAAGGCSSSDIKVREINRRKGWL